MGAITPVKRTNTLNILTSATAFTNSTSGKLFYSNNPETVSTSDVNKYMCKGTGLTGTVMAYTWHYTTFATKNCILLKNESTTSSVKVKVLRSALSKYDNVVSDVDSWAKIFNGLGTATYTIAAGATKALFTQTISANQCFGVIAELSISGGKVTMVDMLYTGTPTMPTADSSHISKSKKQYGVTSGYITTYNPALDIGKAVSFAGGGDSYGDKDTRKANGYTILGNYGQFAKFNMTVKNTGSTNKKVYIQLASIGGDSFPIVQDSSGITKNVSRNENISSHNVGKYYDVISETIPPGGKTISFITCIPAVASTAYVAGVRLA